VHTLVVGVTLSGKSTLARQVLAECIRVGIPAIVYDPLISGWYGARVYGDETSFFAAIIEAANSGKQTLVIIDEADTLLSMSHRHNWWLLLRGRHFGLKIFVLTQRPSLVAPTCRGMCTQCFTFQVSKKDATLLVDDYAAPALINAPKLVQGEYLRAHWVNKLKVVDRGKVF